MADRDSFIFYRSFFEATKPLSKDEKAEIFNAICEFALNQNEVEMQPLTKAMFSLIKPQLEANFKRYLNGTKSKKNKQNRSKTEAKQKQSKNKTLTNVNDNVNDNVNVIKEKIVKKKISFSPPQLLEIENYFLEKTKSIEFSKIHSQRFKDFYESKNWMIGKNKMANWKSAVSGWINRQKDFEKEKSSAKKEKKTGAESFLETVKQSISYE